MIDRILYALASPLAREIIDSLRNDRSRGSQWHVHDILPQMQGGLRSYRIWMPITGRVEIRDEHCTWQMQGPLSRLALRRAIKKWEEAKRDAL